MTVVVAVKKNNKISIASDTMAHFGQRKESTKNHRDRKIYSIGDTWMGASGWMVYDNILEDILSSNHPIQLRNKQQIFRFFMDFWKELHERYTFVKDQVEEDDSPFGDLDSTFLLINPSGIFSVASDMSVIEYNQYGAIGSGADYSLGCLFSLYEGDLDAPTLATKAIECAINFNIYCGGEIDLFTCDVKKDK